MSAWLWDERVEQERKLALVTFRLYIEIARNLPKK